jgi:hypothetical protein
VGRGKISEGRRTRYGAGEEKTDRGKDMKAQKKRRRHRKETEKRLR